MTLYFYAGLGWVTAERLSQPDVAENEAVKDFDCNPENSRKCSDCPHNRNFSDWQASMPCDISIVYHQIGQNASKYFQTKGSFSGCLFFLPCPKSATRPGISYKISEKP